MKIYSREDLIHSRIFFDKEPSGVGLFLMIVTVMCLILISVGSTVVMKPYIVKAEGVVTTTDNQYVTPTVQGSVIELRYREGDEVHVGETILTISNGQESIQSNALNSQLENLTERELALNNFINSLNNYENNLSNQGYEIEYYGKMEYYLSQVDSEQKQTTINTNMIAKKQEKRVEIQKAITDLEKELKELDRDANTDEAAEANAEIEGKANELQNVIETRKNELSAIDEEISQLETQSQLGSQSEATRLQLLSEAGQAKTGLETSRNELEGQLEIYQNQDELFEVKAQNNGKIHYLVPMELGMSVQANQVVAEVSSHGEETKIIEAFIDASERSKVKVGQIARTHVYGINPIQYGKLEGSIISIDEGTVIRDIGKGNQMYYRILVQSNEYSLRGNKHDVNILKSMPVQVQIVYDQESYLMWALKTMNILQ